MVVIVIIGGDHWRGSLVVIIGSDGGNSGGDN